MTTEQAIRELKSDRELYEGDIVYAGDGTPDGDLMLALDMGITALKKQILKKPIKYKDEIVCPTCKNYINITDDDLYVYGIEPPKYCDECGQALDWGDYCE